VFGVQIDTCARCGGQLKVDCQHRGAGSHCEDPGAP
jgi:hypothetical protein